MNELIGRVFDFEKLVFPSRTDLFAKLVADGQSPKALMISCADSRVVPEQIMQADPGDLFVCRNAGNIVPPSPPRTAACPPPWNMRLRRWACATSSSVAIRTAAR